MLPLTTLILGLQGIINLLNGASSLLFPSLAAKNAEAMQTSAAATDAMSLATMSIGFVAYLLQYFEGLIDDRALYINAAYKKDVSVVWWMVLGRAIAVCVFWRYGGMWGNVAIFEGACGVSLAMARGWDIWRESRAGKIGVREKGKEN